MPKTRQHIPYSIEFTDTTGEVINCGDNLDQEYTESISWSGKIFLKSRSSIQGVMSKRLSGSPFTGWVIRLNSGLLEFGLRGDNQSATIFTKTDDLVPLNEWFDFVVTYDGSGNASGVNFYINGEHWSATSTDDDFNDTSSLNSADLVFGWDGVTGANVLNGFLTDLRLHNAELTASQARDAHNGHFVSVEAHWPMTDGVGSTVTETVGSIDGTITDATWSRFSPSLKPVKNRHIPYSALFDASTKELDIDCNFNIGTNDWTVFGWVYFREIETGVSQTVFQGLDGDGTGRSLLLNGSLGTGSMTTAIAGGVQQDFDFVPEPNRWYRFALAYDDTAGTATLYADGRIAGQLTSISASANANGDIRIGSNKVQTSNLNGNVAQPMMLQKACTAAEIEDEYFNGIKPSGTYVFDLDLDEGEGTPVDNEGNTISSFDGSWSRLSPMLARRVVPDIDHSLYFNGVNANVNMGDVLDKERTDSFSFSFWLRPEGTVSHSILSKRTGGNGAGYEVLFLNSGVLGFVLEGSNGNALNVSVDHDVQAKEWHYYTVTYDGSGAGSGVDWYIDGRKVNVTISADDLTADITNSEDFLLGLRAGSTIELEGFLTDVRVHNAKLTSDEAWDLYAKNIAVDVEAHWDFAEGLGTTLTDQVGSFNGTITDATWSPLTP